MSVVACAVTEIVVAIGDSYWRCVSCQLKFSRQTSIDEHVLLKHRGNHPDSPFAETLPTSYHSYNVNVVGSHEERDLDKHPTSDTTCLLPGVVKVNLDNSGIVRSSQSNTPCCLGETSQFPLPIYSRETQAITLPFSFLSHENVESCDTVQSPDRTPHNYQESTREETKSMTLDSVNENAQDTPENQISNELLEKPHGDGGSSKEEDDMLGNGNKSLLNSVLGLLEKSMDMDDITGVIQNWEALSPELFEQQLLNNNGDLSLQSLNSDCVAPDPADNPLNSTEEMLNTAVESFNCSAEFFNSATELLHSSPTEVSKSRKSSSTSDSCAAVEVGLQEKSSSFSDLTIGKQAVSTSNQACISQGITDSKVDECKSSDSESDDSSEDEEEDEVINNVVGLLKGYLKFSSTHCKLLDAVSLTMDTCIDTKTCVSLPGVSKTSIFTEGITVTSANFDSSSLTSSLLSTLPTDLEIENDSKGRRLDRGDSSVTKPGCAGDHVTNVPSNSRDGELRVNTSTAQGLAKLCLLQRQSKEKPPGVPNLFIASSPSPLSCLTRERLKPLMSTVVTPSQFQCGEMPSSRSEGRKSPSTETARKSKRKSKYYKKDGRSKPTPGNCDVRGKNVTGTENEKSITKQNKKQVSLAVGDLEDILCDYNENQPPANKRMKLGEDETTCFSNIVVQKTSTILKDPTESRKGNIPASPPSHRLEESGVLDILTRQIPTEMRISADTVSENSKVTSKKQRALKSKKGHGDGKHVASSSKKSYRGLSALQVRKLKSEVLAIIKQQRKSRQNSPTKKVLAGTTSSDMKSQENEKRKGDKSVLGDQTEKKKTTSKKRSRGEQLVGDRNLKKEKTADKWKVCSVCDRRFSTYGALQRHIKVNTVSSSESCKCKVCGQKFHCLFQLNIHIYKCHETRGKPTCFKCNTQYSHIRCLVQHVQKHKRALQLGILKTQMPMTTKGKAWRCPTCGIICLNQPHIVAAHKCKGTMSQERKCKHCDKTFPSRSSLNIHMATHLGRMYQCDLCGEMFKNKTSRHYHKLSHESVRGQFLCQICGQQFEFQHKLTMHIKIHSKDTKPRPTYKCGDCDKTYKSKKSLQRHIDVQHKGIKDYQYKCEHCNQQFFASWQLRDHIAWHHFGEKPYHCQYCGQGFVCRPTLVRHQRKEHTGDRPYKCQYCEQSFVDKKNLETHEVKVHTKIFPFPCSRCGKGFVHRSSLRSHMAMHSNIRPYQCHICGNCFTKSSHLTRHTQSCMNKNIPQSLTYDLEDLPGIPSRPAPGLAQFMLPQPEDVNLLTFPGNFLDPSY